MSILRIPTVQDIILKTIMLVELCTQVGGGETHTEWRDTRGICVQGQTGTKVNHSHLFFCYLFYSELHVNSGGSLRRIVWKDRGSQYGMIFITFTT